MTLKRLIIFIPSIEGYGVEKNLFIITNFLANHFNQIVVISASNKYKNYFKKKYFFYLPNLNFGKKKVG